MHIQPNDQGARKRIHDLEEKLADQVTRLAARIDQCEAFIEQLNDAIVLHSGKLADLDNLVDMTRKTVDARTSSGNDMATRIDKLARRVATVDTFTDKLNDADYSLSDRINALGNDLSGSVNTVRAVAENALKLAHEALHASMEPEIEEIEDDLATPINEEEWAAWARSIEGYNAMRLVGQYLARGSK
jgi:chromosome segregation ATPase